MEEKLLAIGCVVAVVVLGGVAIAIVTGTRRLLREVLPILISGPKTAAEIRESVQPPEARRPESWYDEMCEVLAEDEYIIQRDGRWHLTLKGRQLASLFKQPSSFGSAS